MRTRLLILSLTLLATLYVFAGQKHFYNSKSNIIGVSGNTTELIARGFDPKIFVNPQLSYSLDGPDKKSGYTDDHIGSVTASLNRHNVGKTVLDYLFANGNTLSETLLKERARINAQRADYELAATSLHGLDMALSEDYLPILENNYIYLEYIDPNSIGKKKVKVYFMVFHVKIDKEILRDVYAAWDDPSAYGRINVPVEYVGQGHANVNLAAPDDNADFHRALSKAADAFAIRGQLIQRNPLKISVGRTGGVKKGDRVTVYSQRVDRQGNLYSKSIAQGRVCGVGDSIAQFFYTNRMSGNRRNGDIVVVDRDRKWSIGLEATYQPHMWGASVTWDWKKGFTRAGFVHHLLGNINFAMTDCCRQAFKFTQNDQRDFLAPVMFGAGVGYGISKYFLGAIDVMLYGLVSYDLGLMPTDDDSYSQNWLSGASYNTSVIASSIRVPLGLRIDINMSSRLQWTLSGGWAFNFGFNDDNDPTRSYRTIKDALECIDARRDGIFISTGLKINF